VALTLTTQTTDTPLLESGAWQGVGAGWHPLFGRYADLGFSFEWHDFETATPLDWARSFHPGSIEVCINLDGVGQLEAGGRSEVIGPRGVAFYFQGAPRLNAVRRPGIRHRFVTVEYSAAFLATHFRDDVPHLHPMVAEVLMGKRTGSCCSKVEPMATALIPVVESLRHCPVFTPARTTWFRCKAIEIATLLFFRPAGGELFCTRAQRAARERIEKVRGILGARLADPPSLETLAREVGCSPYYLSRQFSAAIGMTLQQYLRNLRLERAAELLRSGRCNVTEAAMEVGYNSLSHFSTAFHEKYGCCPGLYPRKHLTHPR